MRSNITFNSEFKLRVPIRLEYEKLLKGEDCNIKVKGKNDPEFNFDVADSNKIIVLSDNVCIKME